jgi:hypothetical protein
MRSDQELSLFNMGYDRPDLDVNILIRIVEQSMPIPDRQKAIAMVQAGHSYGRMELAAVNAGYQDRRPYRY